jgi:hypothetical protein
VRCQASGQITQERAQTAKRVLGLSLWASAATVLDTVRRFYSEPSSDVFPYFEGRGWPGDDIGSFTEERERKLKELFREPDDGFPRAMLRDLGRTDAKQLIEHMQEDGRNIEADCFRKALEALEREGAFGE